MNNIPIIVEDFIAEFMESEYFQGEVFGESAYTHAEVKKGLIEYGKRLRKVILKAAASSEAINVFSMSDGSYTTTEHSYYDHNSNEIQISVDKDSIMNSYPEHLIQ